MERRAVLETASTGWKPAALPLELPPHESGLLPSHEEPAVGAGVSQPTT